VMLDKQIRALIWIGIIFMVGGMIWMAI